MTRKKRSLRYAMGRGFTSTSLVVSTLLLIARLLIDGFKFNYSESLQSGKKLVTIFIQLDKFDYISIYLYLAFLALALGLDNYTLGKLLERIPMLKEFAQKMGGVQAGNVSPEDEEEE